MLTFKSACDRGIVFVCGLLDSLIIQDDGLVAVGLKAHPLLKSNQIKSATYKISENDAL